MSRNLVVYETPIDFSNEGYSTYLKTLPADGNPVFFAAVQRMADREKEASAALLNAAQQASKFLAVKAHSRFYTKKLNSSVRTLRDLDISWDKDLALEMIDRLEVLQISRDTYGTYLTAVLPDQKAGSYAPENTDGNQARPGWTSSIPDIPGYIVSVGISLQTGYTADSFAAADDQALDDLARQISIKIISEKNLIQNSIGTASVQTNYEESEVIIPGFYVIERWRTPDARYYYTLAAAPDSILEVYRND